MRLFSSLGVRPKPRHNGGTKELHRLVVKFNRLKSEPLVCGLLRG